MKPLLIALLLVAQVATQELSSTLHSTIYGALIAYADETVVFTCIVRGSNSIVWTSEEYIGTGVRLSLSSAQGVGHRVTALQNAQTVAILINASIDTDMIIVSELHIRVQSTYPISSVQCVDSSTNAVTSTSFFLPDLAQVTCDRQSVCAGDSVICTCVTGNSTSLAWMSNGNRLSFTSSDPLLTRRNVPGSNRFAVLTENSNVNGIRVIMSNITVNVSSDDPEIILTCESVDRTMIKPFIIPTTRTEDCLVNPTDQVETPTAIDPGNENTSSKNSCTGPVTAAVVIPVIVIVFTIVAIPIIIVITHKKIRKDFQAQLEEKDKEMNNLVEEKQALEGKVWDLTSENDQLKGKMEILRREVKRKDDLMKSKSTELQQLKNTRDKAIDEESKCIKRLESQMKEKDKNIGDLKKEIDQNREKLFRMDTQMDTEKAKISQELKKSMKKEAQETLRALRNKVNEGIDQAMSRDSSTEKEVTLEDMRKKLESLKTSLEKEFKQILEDKEEDASSTGFFSSWRPWRKT